MIQATNIQKDFIDNFIDYLFPLKNSNVKFNLPVSLENFETYIKYTMEFISKYNISKRSLAYECIFTQFTQILSSDQYM